MDVLVKPGLIQFVGQTLKSTAFTTPIHWSQIKEDDLKPVFLPVRSYYVAIFSSVKINHDMGFT